MTKMSEKVKWPWRRLGDVARYINGAAFKPTDWSQKGLPIIRIQNLTDVTAPFNYYSGQLDEKFRVRDGDLLVSWSATLDVFRWERGEAWLNQHIFRVEEDTSLVTRDYLTLAIRHALDELQAQTHGTTMMHIKRKPFENTLIPVPELGVQRQFVAHIEKVTSRLEQALQIRRLAHSEAKSSSRSTIAGAFSALANTPIRKLGNIAGIIGGTSIPETGPRPESEEDRVGLMKVSDMNTEGNETVITRCRLETTKGHAAKLRLRVVPRGAVVFPKRGGAIATNKKRTLAISAALDPNMMGVFPLEGSGLTPPFLRWWFESIDLVELQEDGGIPQVNKKHLAPLEIPLPSLTEQHRIVARLDALAEKQSELYRLQGEMESDLVTFTPALLAKAFRSGL